jgi:hypothetical protein
VLLVPLGFFIKAAAVLGFGVGGVGGVPIGTRVHIALVHEWLPASHTKVIARHPRGVALRAVSRFFLWHYFSSFMKVFTKTVFFFSWMLVIRSPNCEW